jgi:hypothetical protein
VAVEPTIDPATQAEAEQILHGLQPVMRSRRAGIVAVQQLTGKTERTPCGANGFPPSIATTARGALRCRRHADGIPVNETGLDRLEASRRKRRALWRGNLRAGNRESTRCTPPRS